MSKPLYQKELPSSDPRDPRPVDFTIHAPHTETEGKFGTQYLYDGTYEGEDRTLYASAGLHRAIQDAGPEPGIVLSILRTGEGKDTRWSVVQRDDHLYAKSSAPGNPPSSSKPVPTVNTRDTYLNNVNRYGVAWDHAKGFLAKKGDTADINAVAFTFYKMAQDAKCDLLEFEEARGKD